MNASKSLFAIATALAAAAIAAHAMPAPPHPVIVTQPDGSRLEVLLCGDEHGHIMLSADGSRMLRRDAAGMFVDAGAATPECRRLPASERKLASPARIVGESPYPAHGKQRALAILVDFPETEDHPAGLSFSSEDPRQLFDDMLNLQGYSHSGATGSVHDYYYDSSDGLFDLSFDVYGPVTLSRDLAFYGTKINGEDLNAWNMVVEACTALDDRIDFKDYDRDYDGIIDNVYIFYAGPGAATGGDPTYTIWQHASDVETITGQQFLFDGVRLNHYACSNEYRDVRNADGSITRQTEGIGTVCHEFSHVLGLPDLYDTEGANITPGDWSLMDTGCHLNSSRTPPLMSAYERSVLGWLDPRIIGKTPESVTLRDLSYNEACMIETANDNEYFLLENRRIAGWDSYLPGHGMLIWHINYMEDMWRYNKVNTVRGYLGVDIVRADGSNDYESRDGDTFPGATGVTGISDEGFPNMLSYDGSRTNAPISSIREAGNVIYFDVCRNPVHLDKVTGVTVTGLQPDRFTVSWQPVTGADAAYKLYVYTKEDDTHRYTGNYSGLVVDDVSFEVTGLQPGTEYFVQVAAFSGNVTGELSDEVCAVTPEMSFEYTAPVAEEAAEVSERAFTARWQPLEGACGYALTVYTKTKGEPDYCSIDFSDGIESLPAGWTTNCSFTMSIGGYYGQSAPSLSMTDDYARVQSPFLKGTLRSISFWYRERSASGNSRLEISALAEDGSWVDVDCINLPERMSAGETYAIDENDAGFPNGCRAVRLVYRRVDSGTLALDDIEIGYNDKYQHNILAGHDRQRTDATEAVVDGLEAGKAYCYIVEGVDQNGVYTLPSNEISVTTAISGITEICNAAPSVTVSADGIVTVDGHVDIFDIQGRAVRGSRLPGRGIYIVRSADIVTKIVY